MRRVTNKPDKNKTVIASIRQHIEKSNRILVVSHIRPDGDAVGSVLGLGLALQASGKDVQMVLQDGVPHNLKHLSGSEQVKQKPDGPVDLIIVVDVSDVPRLGNVLEGYGIPDINIDHHYTNENFARYNLVESECAATTEILAGYLSEFGLPIDRQVADALLTGLITDTIGFRTANVKPDTLRIVAALIDAGGSLSDMYYPALVQRTLEGVRYWGAGLSKLHQHDRLVWTALSLEDRQNAGYTGNDDADLINILSAIEGADVAMIMVEQSPSRVKISWRLSGQAEYDIDVSKIAGKFGGGGHKAAAGAEVDGTLAEVIDSVVRITQEYLAYHFNPSA